MTTQRRKILSSLMKGNRLRYLGAIGAMIVGVGIGLVTPVMLSGTIDALVNAVARDGAGD